VSRPKRPAARRVPPAKPQPLVKPKDVPRYVRLRRFLANALTDAVHYGELVDIREIRLPDGEPEDEANSFGIVFEDGKLLTVEIMEP
jgi:hypothetical protein